MPQEQKVNLVFQFCISPEIEIHAAEGAEVVLVFAPVFEDRVVDYLPVVTQIEDE